MMTVYHCILALKEMADELWRRHLIRNNSEIVELFHGQIKSVLKCLTCTKVYNTFHCIIQYLWLYRQLKPLSQ